MILTEKVRSRLWESDNPACSCSRIRLRSLVEASFALSKANFICSLLAAVHDSSISSVIRLSSRLIFSSGLK